VQAPRSSRFGRIEEETHRKYILRKAIWQWPESTGIRRSLNGTLGFQIKTEITGPLNESEVGDRTISTNEKHHFGPQ
jgi:hypothetical protein